ncbi:hypothetical protein ACTD33_004639, partial [Escherichia coli]
ARAVCWAHHAVKYPRSVRVRFQALRAEFRGTRAFICLKHVAECDTARLVGGVFLGECPSRRAFVWFDE